ncbi:MAG TPA: M55 family metallopeptidase [Candidatus Sumerlaeota bacterium]|nr:M55 family metallopeptidase [Candidatus Sumerlaeota bacterium]
MKLYVSIDIEGIAGVPSWEFGSRKQMDYPIGRELMAGELNAAIEGALEAGMTEIVVNDSHGNMVNLNPMVIHRAARLLQGERKPWSMMEGMDQRYDAAIFIGYHAKAGTFMGSMCHTYCGAVSEASMNGVPWGEVEINGAFCGTYGTPLVMVSGDEALAEETRAFIPNIVAVPVKKAYGMRATLSLHPEEARARIKAGVIEAIRNREKIAPFTAPSPSVLEVRLREPDMADMCSRIPFVQRLDGLRVRFEHTDYRQVFKAFLLIMGLASSV